MDASLAVVFSVTCFYTLIRLARPRDVIDLHVGVIGLFSVGYYCLPVFFKDLSHLNWFTDGEVFSALLIHWLFLISLIFGTEIGRTVLPKNIAWKAPALDALADKARPALAVTAFAIYLTYYFTQKITSYTSGDMEAYFRDRGPFYALISGFGNLSLATLSVIVAQTWKAEGRKVELALYGGMLGFCVFLNLFLGQRLALLAPIIMLLGSLFSTGQLKRANRLLGVAVATLLVVSPIAVFIRESLADRHFTDAQAAVNGFSYGEDPLSTMFKSIVKRGDLIYVTVRMKPYLDQEPPLGLVYYASAFVQPVPKIIMPNKPYLLSSNGLPSGDLSIMAWGTLLGGTGSLSAFGGIVAYREAGWPGVIFNGFATGMLFAFLSYWLARGGFVARVFYAQLFVLLAVKKVPPSFFEALGELVNLAPFLLAAFLLAWVVGSIRKPKDTARRPQGQPYTPPPQAT